EAGRVVAHDRMAGPGDRANLGVDDAPEARRHLRREDVALAAADDQHRTANGRDALPEIAHALADACGIAKLGIVLPRPASARQLLQVVTEAVANVGERAAGIEGMRALYEVLEGVELVGRGDEVADVVDPAALHLGRDVDHDERPD